MTLRLYYTDPSCATFDAVVVETAMHEGRPAVVLDRTAFYPTSGGQPHDTGKLGGVHVVDVVDRDDGRILHVIDGDLQQGAHVEGAIDWMRRFDHMQQHTGQHVLSAAFERLFKNRTVSFHMGTEASTIDLAAEASADAIHEAEREANRIVWEDRSVSIRFVEADAAAALPLRKEPARGGTLRLIEVSDFDLSACGGTHVARTGSIGIIAAAGSERFRGGTRVTFVCGGRVLQLLATLRQAVGGSVRLLSILPGELPGAIERIQTESKELKRALKTMQEAAAVHEAARLVAAAPVVNGVRVVVAALEGWDAVGLKAIAAAATSRDQVVAALFSTSRPIVAVVARAAGAKADAQAVLKMLVQQFGGRGGGRPDLAQCGGLEGDVAAIVQAARAALDAQLRE